jgi:hypothetical protein
MTKKLVEIARFDDLFRAETVRIGLEELGIPVFIESSETNRAMHYIGTALGGVKVLVPEEKKAEALAAIVSFTESASSTTPEWICGECGEQVDAGFETCWSCGAGREAGMAVPPPSATFQDELAAPNDPNDPGEATLPTNPYESPKTSTADSPQVDEAETPDATKEAEAIVLRAWRASVIGVVLCPVLLHIYSMYILIDSRDAAPLLSAEGKRRRLWAMIINSLMLALGLWFVCINLVDFWRFASDRR